MVQRKILVPSICFHPVQIMQLYLSTCSILFFFWTFFILTETSLSVRLKVIFITNHFLKRHIVTLKKQTVNLLHDIPVSVRLYFAVQIISFVYGLFFVVVALEGGLGVGEESF